MWPKTSLRSSLAKAFSAGLVVTLIAGCATHVYTPVQLPNESRKFKIGKEAPESFEFFRSDEEIRGRLLAGVWKSREIKSISYSESKLSVNNFKPSRVNSPLVKTTSTLIFREDGEWTSNIVSVYENGGREEVKRNGKWIVLNGGLQLLTTNSGSEVVDPRSGFYSIRFLDNKTFEMFEDDFVGSMEEFMKAQKEIDAKKGVQYFRQNWKKFRDENGNVYQINDSKFSEGNIRSKVLFIHKSSPSIFELQ
ncbi:MAG: hypothetical protein IKW49_03120 [Opitutales bacterium]|nr:hypothetical protein [Opitutales bacterium]